MARKVIPERVEVVKEKIIDSAIELIGQDGYANFSLSKLASEVGMTKAALYWYFKSKDDVLEAVAQSLQATFIGFASEILSKDISAKDKILKLASTVENEQNAQRCFYVIKMFVEMQSVNANISSMIEEGYKGYARVVRDIFEEALVKKQIKTSFSAEQLTSMLIALLDGYVLQKAIYAQRQIDCKDIILSLVGIEGEANESCEMQ